MKESVIVDSLSLNTTNNKVKPINSEGGLLTNMNKEINESIDNELKILNMINESLQDQVDNEDNPEKKSLEIDSVDNINDDESSKYNNTNSDEPVVDLIDKDGNVHCDVCGTIFKLEDGAVCPVCGTDHSNVVDDPQTFAESLFTKYESLVNEGKFAEAKSLLESNEATVLCEGNELVLEAYKIHVDSTGKKSKVKVKTKHKKLSSAQKKALAKARKKSHTGSANKARVKAINKRASMGLNESLVKVGTSDDDEFDSLEPLPGDSRVRVFSTDDAYVVVGRDDDDDETVVAVCINDDNADDSYHMFANRSELTDKEALDLAEKLAKKLSKAKDQKEALKILKSSPEMMKESVDTDESCTDDDTDECSCKVNESVKFEEDGGGFCYAEISDDLNVTYGYDEDIDEYTVYITAMNDDQDQYLAMAEAHYEDDAKRIATSIATKLAKSPTKSSVAQLVKKYNMDDDDSDIDLKDTSLKESTDCEDDDDDEIIESYKVHISSDGTKTKKKVRTKRVHLTSAQKAALRKARKKSHTGAANKSRAKAMKKRRSLGL